MAALHDKPEHPSRSSPAQDRSIKEAALEYVRRGHPVVRLKPGAKVPDVTGWNKAGRGKDPKVIDQWFDEQPDANIGIVCGNGFIVIDVDGRNDGLVNWLEFVGESGPNGSLGAEPPRVVTPGGGMHLHFRVPPGVKIGNRAGFIPGVDVRGDGGQVVAPPSIHPNGDRYAWGTKDFVTGERYSASDPVPMMPSWLLTRLMSETADHNSEPESALDSSHRTAELGASSSNHEIEEVEIGAAYAIESITLESSASTDPSPEEGNRSAPADAQADVKMLPRKGDQSRSAQKAPRKPPERSRRKQAGSDGRIARKASRAKLAPFKAVPLNSAESRAILADMIARFPVPEFGHRHEQMTWAVGRLVGKGYEDGVIVEVMMLWFEHFHSAGVIRSDRPTMAAELEACLRSTRSNPKFRIFQNSSSSHVAEIAAWEIPQFILDKLDMPASHIANDLTGRCAAKSQDASPHGAGEQVCSETLQIAETQSPDPPGGIPTQLLMVSHLSNSRDMCETGIRDRVFPSHVTDDSPSHIDDISPYHIAGLSPSHTDCSSPSHTDKRSCMKRICESGDERCFLECFIAAFLRQQSQQRGSVDSTTISLTNNQIRDIAVRRFSLPERPWKSDNQIDRLKQKYISRPGTDGRWGSVERFELFRQVAKGNRARGTTPATPSVYQPTGILTLMELDRQARGSSSNDAA
jgi:hypothetical protein